jgi:uncharacterized protein with FMN-binding domain
MTDRSHPPSRIPVRGALALALTVGGLSLLLSFRTPADTGPATVRAVAAQPSATEELLPAALPADPSPAATDATPTRRPFAGVTESTADEAAATVAALRLVGEPVAIRWGEVQVAVTLEGGDIIDVETLALPLGDRHSSGINQRAEPVLRQQAIATDSADVDVVSGATYTSRAYALSLQSALDQLG